MFRHSKEMAAERQTRDRIPDWNTQQHKRRTRTQVVWWQQRHSNAGDHIHAAEFAYCSRRIQWRLKKQAVT
jgi:hypothetical protein